MTILMPRLAKAFAAARPMPLAAPVTTATRSAMLRSPGDIPWDPMRLVGAILTTAFFLIPITLTAWAFLDAARRPAWAWSLAGRSQAAWMAAVFLGVLTVIGGLLISGYYLTVVRPEIAAAEDGQISG